MPKSEAADPKGRSGTLRQPSAQRTRQSYLEMIPDHREALSWLRGHRKGDRTVGELGSRAESLRLVSELYELGATKVFVTNVDEYEGDDGTTSRLIVLLPRGVRARKKLFARFVELDRSSTDVTDSGAPEFLLTLD